MRLVALALALAPLAAPVAVADVLTFRFDGVVDSNTFTSGPWTFADPGDEFIISYSFDTGASDSNPDPSLGDFSDSINSFAVIAGTAFQVGGVGSIQVVNNSAGQDAYGVTMPLTAGLAASINLTDLSQAAFASDALPLDLALDSWQGRLMRVGSAPTGGPEILGTIRSFTIIPAPAAGVTLLGCLLAPRRRRAFA